jgi:hypothetical protein
MRLAIIVLVIYSMTTEEVSVSLGLTLRLRSWPKNI